MPVSVERLYSYLLEASAKSYAQQILDNNRSEALGKIKIDRDSRETDAGLPSNPTGFGQRSLISR